jgi:hypothetical protein
MVTPGSLRILAESQEPFDDACPELSGGAQGMLSVKRQPQGSPGGGSLLPRQVYPLSSPKYSTPYRVSWRCPSQEGPEFINGEAGLSNQAPEKTRPQLLMQGDGEHDRDSWLDQADVTPPLACAVPTCAFERPDRLLPGANRKLRPRCAPGVVAETYQVRM